MYAYDSTQKQQLPLILRRSSNYLSFYAEAAITLALHAEVVQS